MQLKDKPQVYIYEFMWVANVLAFIVATAYTRTWTADAQHININIINYFRRERKKRHR